MDILLALFRMVYLSSCALDRGFIRSVLEEFKRKFQVINCSTYFFGLTLRGLKDADFEGFANI